MLADRVNEEGVLHDLASGRVPNILAGRGRNAEWEHNRTRLVGRVLVGAILLSAAVGMIAATRARANSSELD